MTPKEKIRAFVERMPHDVIMEQVFYKLELFVGVETGLQQLERGEGIDHDELFDELLNDDTERGGDAMTDKEKIIAMFRRLPDNITIKQGMYHLHVLSKIEQGLKESEQGLGKDHDELMAELEIEHG